MALSMTPDELDSLLITWHRWSASDLPPLGYPSECPTFRLYRPTNVWKGYEYRIEDGREELCAPSAYVGRVGPMVERCVYGQKHGEGWLIEPMERMHQLALEWLARCLAIKTSAIRNPRLPQGRELDELVSAARAALASRLDG